MKTKAIVATLLIAAAASADARFGSPFPRKAVPPDESGHWIMINSNPWSHGVREKCRTSRNGPPAAPKNRRGDFTFSEMSVFKRLRKVHEEKIDS
jgi:hypothetical protein